MDAEPGGAPDVVRVLVRRLDPDLPLPRYAMPGDAGADLLAREDVELPPGGRASVPTGVALALPEGYAAFVHPRSGLAARHGVTTLNGPGTVDAGYRGEVVVTLVNTDLEHAFAVRRGDRVAQLVVQRVSRAELVVVDELPPSSRGAGGHGSTGGWSTAAAGRATVEVGTGRPGSTPSTGTGTSTSSTPSTTTSTTPGTPTGAEMTTTGGPRTTGEEQP